MSHPRAPFHPLTGPAFGQPAIPTAVKHLRADRASHTIELPDGGLLSQVPDEFWQYELGGKACVEHVLDGWRARLRPPRDATLRERFPKPKAFTPEEVEQMVDHIARMCTVAVESMKIISQLASISPLNPANHPPGWRPAGATKPAKASPPPKVARPGFVQLSLFYSPSTATATPSK